MYFLEKSIALVAVLSLTFCSQQNGNKKGSDSSLLGAQSDSRHFDCEDPFVGHYEVQSTGLCANDGVESVIPTSGYMELYCNGEIYDEVYYTYFGFQQRLGSPEIGTWREIETDRLRMDEGLPSQADYEKVLVTSSGIQHWFTRDEGAGECNEGVTLKVKKRVSE